MEITENLLESQKKNPLKTVAVPFYYYESVLFDDRAKTNRNTSGAQLISERLSVIETISRRICHVVRA